jgi:hypothetical protein
MSSKHQIVYFVIIIGAVALALALAVYFIYVSFFPAPPVQDTKLSAVVEKVSCISAGEYKKDEYSACCVGLVERDTVGIFNENCQMLFGATTSLPICISCGDGECDPSLESECNCREDCNTENCIEAGEYVDLPYQDSFTCCPGLVKANALPLDGNCQSIIPENSPGIEPGWTCLQCGDAICDKGKGENKCNCPADCDGLIFKKTFIQDPCPDPDNSCWQREYLFGSGEYRVLNKNGTTTKVLDSATLQAFKDYLVSSGLLTKTCGIELVADYWVTYNLSLRNQKNVVTFPGCQEEMAKLEEYLK